MAATLLSSTPAHFFKCSVSNPSTSNLDSNAKQNNNNVNGSLLHPTSSSHSSVSIQKYKSTLTPMNPLRLKCASSTKIGSSRGKGASSLNIRAIQSQRSAEADVMGMLLRERIIFLGYELNDYVADAIVSQLILLDAQDSNRDIRLFINSPGGSISSAMGIYDAIQLCRANVSTIAFGLAASTATIILAGGTKGKRFAMPNARIMMHQPMGGASGQAIDVEIQAKEIMHHKTNITRIFSEITQKPKEQVEKDIDRDRYMSPAEAMDYGIIDGVIDEQSILPLQPLPPKMLRKPEFAIAETDPDTFLNPKIPDDEIF